MRGIQTTITGRVLSVALSGALLLGNLGAGASVALAGDTPPLQQPAAPPSPSVVRELTDNRTATSREFELSDGTIRAQYFTEPIHYRDKTTGRFVPIDPTLREITEDGRQLSVSRANSIRVELPKTLDSQGVSVEASDCAVRITPAGGQGAVARSDSATERAYPAALNGAVLTYESRPEGLKESIVLPKALKDTSWAFDLRLEGLTPRIESDGSVSLVRPSGVVAFLIPKPYMFDSSTLKDGRDYSDAVRYTISGEGPTYRLDVVADPTWINDPARVFPLTIDPTVETSRGTLGAGTSGDDTFISSPNNSTNYVSHTLTWLRATGGSVTGTEYGYVHPPVSLHAGLATKKSQGRYVVASRFVSYISSGNFVASGNMAASMCPTSNVVSLSSITWLTYASGNPSPTVGYGTPLVSVSSAGTKTLDVTDMTEHWQQTDVQRNKCTFKWSIAAGAHVGFDSADNTSAHKPYWEVDYAPYPSVTLSSPSTGTVSDIPSASWVMTETLGNTQAEWALEVATSAAGPAIATTGAANAATSSALPVPSGGWVPGTTYWVRVHAATAPSTQRPRFWSQWATGNFTPTLPQAVSTLSHTTTASANWFTEIDSNGDGVNDARDDAPDYGRGSVTLSWPAATGATSYKVFMHDGNTYRQVGTASSTSWSSAGKGIFPTDSQIASLSANTTANPLPSGTGLDLRDDPRGLYAKTAGSSLDATAAYQFKVVAANGAGECASASPEALVALDNRTLHVNDAPNHSNVDLTSMLGHDAAVELDTGALTLSATDLEIASWGPRAALNRYYSSDVSSAPSFAPGWRFGFERSLSVSGTSAVYTDEYGDAYRYRASGPLWISGTGDYSTLATSIAGATITTKERSALSFDIAGQLVSEADANGNTVTYTRGEDLTITAANGQSIVVDRDVAGTVLSATYSTAAGTRRVDYTTSPTAKVTYSYAPTSTVGYSVSMGYADGRLTSLACTESGTNWSVTYGSGTTSVTVENTSGDGSPSYRRTVSRNAASRTATVVTFDATQAFAWNPSGTLASKSNPGAPAEVTSWRYSPSNDQIEERSPAGRTNRTAYDARGNAIRIIDQAGLVTWVAYDAYDRGVWQCDPRGSETTTTYDAAGNMLSQQKTVSSGGLPARGEYSYDSCGRITGERTRIDADTWMETSETAFASNGSPQRTTSRGVRLAAGGELVDLVEHVRYDSFGNQLERGDAAGVTVTVASFDAAGEVLTSTDASGVVTNATHDSLGREVASWRSHPSTTARLGWEVRQYDAVGNLVRVARLDSAGSTISTRSFIYDSLGRQTGSDDSSVAGSSVAQYDASGRADMQWTEGRDTSVASASTRRSWDQDGNMVSVLRPGATTSATVSLIDSAGRIGERRGADGVLTDFDYDSAGAQCAESVPSDMGTATAHSEYGLSGAVATQTAPNGVATVLERNLDEQVVAARSGNQTASTTVYNSRGWVLTRTDFDGIVKSFTYDADGRVVSESVGSLTTTHAFDSTGREVSRSNPDGSAVVRVFDLLGRVVTEAATGTDGQCAKCFTYSYDSRGRVVERTESVSGASARYAYSADGWVTLTETRRGNTLVSTIDSTGLLRSVDGTLSGARVDWSVTATDSAGRVVGGTSATFVNDWAIGYDQAGRIIHPSEVNGGIPKWGTYVPGGPQSVPAWGVNYVYSPTTGKKVSEDLQFNSGWYVHSAYVYDLNGRATSATVGASTTAYGYDSVSGALKTVKPSAQPTTSLSYSGLGRLTSVGSRNYVSDPIGRRIWAGPSGNPSETAYSWSGERLTGFRSASTTASYVYDATGQRTRSVVTSGSLVTTTTFDYDGLRLLGLSAQRSDGPTWSVDYVYDERGVVFAGTYRASDATPVAFLMVTSDRGDVRELIDRAGRSFAHYEYDVYGNPTQKAVVGTLADWNPSGIDTSTASAITSRQVLRYAGYAFDEHAQMYYCSQRYYDPASYQWLSRDPAKADGEESTYQYSAGDPVETVDPTGLFSIEIGAARGGWGHSWIRVANTNAIGTKAWMFRGIYMYPHTFMYFGWWPDNIKFDRAGFPVSGGVWINKEPAEGSGGELDDRLAVRVTVPQSKIQALSDYIKAHKAHYHYIEDNCTEHAVGAWQAAGAGGLVTNYAPEALYAELWLRGGQKTGWGLPWTPSKKQPMPPVGKQYYYREDLKSKQGW